MEMTVDNVWAAESVRDHILCSAESNSSLLVNFYNFENTPSGNWAEWTELPLSDAVSIALTKEYQKGTPMFQVSRIQEEIRYAPADKKVLFTVQFQTFSSIIEYSKIPPYTIWNALGIIGGFIVLMQVLAECMYCCVQNTYSMITKEAFDPSENSIQQEGAELLSKGDYGTLDSKKADPHHDQIPPNRANLENPISSEEEDD
eukprot:TRINITY_DN1743_c0_g1_i1.p1 TRINITY_DN1743_c0_g1~~TRINITY_DN1743_c0_g1_i1.p1  ORF type:complete len:202 (-),score=28.54 TRINITY_DN1743_c0_g1_i1:30-635(-)